MIMTPISLGYDMNPNKGENLKAEIIRSFQRKIGSVVYAAMSTGPDIA